MFEKPKVIGFERGLELQDKKDENLVEKIRARISRLQEGKEKFEEWQRFALEQGDEQNASLYKSRALEIENMIIDGEILCNEFDKIQDERWQKYFKHVAEIESSRALIEHLENVEFEFENVSSFLESLLEDVEDGDEKNRQKIQELQGRKEALEVERLLLQKKIENQS